MTSAYRAAVNAGDRPVTIAGNSSGSISATTTTGGAVAAALQKFNLNVANTSGSDRSGIEYAATNRDNSSITFFNAGLSEGGHAQQVTTLHEGLHATVVTGWDTGAPQPEHRPSFNDAAEQILDYGE